ncbi:DNA polymerase III subunit beta [Microbispora sp. NPDC049125]|uniref:DNA polymerase III subunit beta n=1 Tax=Microbispora sp. NPDC049125 TaxID=3154929 RepID=UPI0034673DCD
MKFTCEYRDLAAGLGWVARTLPAKAAHVILNGLLFEVDDDGVLHVSAFDYEQSAAAVVPTVTSSPGRAVLPGKLLKAILDKSPKESFEVVADDGVATVTCGRVRLEIPLMPIESYPALPPFSDLRYAGAMDGDAFASAVNQVAFATSNDSSTPQLTTVLLTFEPDQVAFLGSDRHRMGLRLVEFDSAEGLTSCVLVPPRLLVDAARIAQGRSVEVYLSDREVVDEIEVHRRIGVKIGGRSATSTVLARQFQVPYTSFLLPTEGRTVATFDVADLKAAMERARLVLNPVESIALEITSEGMELRGGSEARLIEPVAANVEGDEVTVLLNPSFMVDGLDAIGTQVARLTVQEPRRPVMLTPSWNGGEVPYRYIMMPVSPS